MRLLFDCIFWKRAIDRMTPTERGLFSMCIESNTTVQQAFRAVYQMRAKD